MTIDLTAATARLDIEEARVEALRRDLQARLDAADGGEGVDGAELDPADAAVDTVERQKNEAILAQLDEELAEIGAARQRIVDGTYGIDEVTGEPIDPARLEARPMARTNVGTGSGRTDRRSRAGPAPSSSRRTGPTAGAVSG